MQDIERAVPTSPLQKIVSLVLELAASISPATYNLSTRYDLPLDEAPVAVSLPLVSSRVAKVIYTMYKWCAKHITPCTYNSSCHWLVQCIFPSIRKRLCWLCRLCRSCGRSNITAHIGKGVLIARLGSTRRRLAGQVEIRFHIEWLSIR